MEFEKFKKYINEPTELKLKALDGTTEIFELKPLPLPNICDILIIGKVFAKIPKDSPEEEFLELLDEDTIKRMIKLVKKTLEISYPNLPEDIRDGFASRNFLELIMKIFEINSMGSEAEVIEERIKQIKSRRKSKVEKNEHTG